MPQRKTTKAQYIKRRKRRKRQQRLAVVLLGLAVVFVLSILGLKALFNMLSGDPGIDKKNRFIIPDKIAVPRAPARKRTKFKSHKTPSDNSFQTSLSPAAV